MRRLVLLLAVAGVMTLVMALSALPAMAVNSRNQPPGPPFQSGSPTGKTTAFHCKAIDFKGAAVTNKNGQPTRCR
jgi:hypothetical protein